MSENSSGGIRFAMYLWEKADTPNLWMPNVVATHMPENDVRVGALGDPRSDHLWEVGKSLRPIYHLVYQISLCGCVFWGVRAASKADS